MNLENTRRPTAALVRLDRDNKRVSPSSPSLAPFASHPASHSLLIFHVPELIQTQTLHSNPSLAKSASSLSQCQVMPKPRDLGANSTNRGLYSRFNMAKLSDKAPPSAAGSTFKGRSSPSSPSVMGRVAPSPKSDTPSKLPRRIFGRPSDGKDTNVSQSNTPTQRRTRATPRSSPQRAHALQPQADVTRSTPDKPLPSLPAARLALESPKKPGRTLLDASELPLRVSPGTPEEGEWPSLSPWRPLTQGAKSSNENLQSSYGGANLNASHNLSTPLPAHVSP